jgi:hypothetical protein
MMMNCRLQGYLGRRQVSRKLHAAHAGMFTSSRMRRPVGAGGMLHEVQGPGLPLLRQQHYLSRRGSGTAIVQKIVGRIVVDQEYARKLLFHASRRIKDEGLASRWADGEGGAHARLVAHRDGAAGVFHHFLTM